MRRIDELHLNHPFFGSRMLTQTLKRQGVLVNRKRVQRLMRLMDLESMAPKPKTSEPAPEHPRYPKTGGHLCTALPLDKHKNADRHRGRLHPVPPASAPLPPACIAPHLRALMQEYAQTGLPPAYLPKESVSTLAHKPDQPLDKETP
jgi:hypothetical protein